MLDSQVFWTVIPKNIDFDRRQLQVTVLASPRTVPPPGSPPRTLTAGGAFDQWPHFLAQHLQDFELGVVDEQGQTFALQQMKLISRLDPEMWDSLFENSPVDAWAPPRQPPPMTTNGATQVLRHLRELTHEFFAAEAEHLEEIRTKGLLAVPSVPSTVTQKHFKYLDWWLPSGHTSAPCSFPAAGTQSPQATRPGTLKALLAGLSEEPDLYEIAERNFYRLARSPECELTARVLDSVAKLSGGEGFSEVHPETEAFLRTVLFHSRVKRQRADTANPVDLRSLVRTGDVGFNERVAMIANHPAFLKPLGLALDLTAEWAANGQFPRRGSIQLRRSPSLPLPPPLPFDSIFAWTAYTTESGVFRAADAEGPAPQCRQGAASAAPHPLLSEGRLRVGDPALSFQLVALDVDGAALGLVHATKAALDSSPTPSQDGKAAPASGFDPPSQRSAGITLLHEGRPEALAKRLQKVVTNSAASEPTLFAEDLVRGYIVDAFARNPKTGGWRWYSLCAREEAFRFGALGTPDDQLRELPPASPSPDPGHGSIQLGAARALDKVDGRQTPPADLHVHEAIFRWQGWSLTVPMPGESIPPDDTSGSPTAPVNRPRPWRILPTYSVPESAKLPPLRFGMRFRFALRAVDLVGDPMAPSPPPGLDECFVIPNNAHPAAETERDPDEELTTGAQNVGTTFRYLRYDPVPPPIVLLTSDLPKEKHPGENLRRMVLRAGHEGVERCFIPPLGSMRLAELHGKFDSVTPADAGGLDVELIEEHEVDPTRPRHWELPRDSSHNPLYRRARRALSEEERQIAERHFLPDPVAAFLCVIVEDLVSGERRELRPEPFYCEANEWPKARPLFVRLEGRDADDVGGRYGWRFWGILAVHLPPAWVVRLRVSCGLRPEDIRLMAHCNHWERRNLAPGGVSHTLLHPTLAAVVDGCHPMISPQDELTLIHAVPAPLAAPRIIAITAERGLHETGVDLDVKIEVDRKSVGKLDLMAEWTEAIDDLTREGPETKPQRTQVAEIQVPSPDEAGDFDPQGRTVIAPLQLIRQSFVDTRFRDVRYTAVAHSRFAQYFDPGQAYTLSSEPFPVPIPNTAPPGPPIVSYVIPTFLWHQRDEPLALDPGHRYHSERRASGLRVYLDRPWPAALEGELLGVVIWRSLSQEQTAALAGGRVPWIEPTRFDEVEGSPVAPYVTSWGVDPLWRGAAGLSTLPTASDFEGATAWSDGLPLLELAGSASQRDTDALVSVVGYPPTYDPDKRLWYADVVLRPAPSYFTFIRLALVRYQPRSVKGAEISLVALADFSQLLPDRAVTVTRVPGQRQTLSINIFGQQHEAQLPRPGPNRFTVTVERPCSPAAADGDMGWVPDGSVVAEPVPGPQGALWSGRVMVACGCGPMRLVIQEYEPFLADGEHWELVDDERARMTERLVYADVLEL